MRTASLRLGAFLAALGLMFAIVATVSADAGNPATISGSLNGSTATLSGTWDWISRGDTCTNRWTGWAVDWDDPTEPGHPVPSKQGGTFHVGTNTDNRVHVADDATPQGDCGHMGPDGYIIGDWGPISHAYPGPGTYHACVLIYDIHLDGDGHPKKASEMVAGGTGHNRDNSAETNGLTPEGTLGAPCIPMDIVIPPIITVTKSASPTSRPVPGGSFTFNVSVHNDSSGAVTLTSLVDDVYGDLDGEGTCATGGAIAAGATYACSFSRTFTGAAGAHQTDTVTATVTDGQQHTASAHDDATITLVPAQIPTPAIHVSKSASPTTLPVGGGSVTYAYSVSNPGGVPLSSVSVTDNRCSPVTYLSGDTSDLGWLDLGETWTFHCVVVVASTTTNTATATGYYQSAPVQDTAQATVTVAAFTPAPRIAVSKTASPTTLPAGGGIATWTFLISNPGNVPLSSVSLADNLCGPVTYLGGDTSNPGWLDVGEAWSFRCAATLATTTINTATATGWSGQTRVTAQAQATVVVLLPGPTPTSAVGGVTSPPQPVVTLPPTDAARDAGTAGTTGLPAILLVLVTGIIAAPAVAWGRRRRTS